MNREKKMNRTDSIKCLWAVTCFLAFSLGSACFAEIWAQDAGEPEAVRDWRLVNGQTYYAKWETARNENPDVIYLRVDQKTYEVKVADLSPADQNYVINKRIQASSVGGEEGSETAEELTVVMVDDLSKPGSVPGERRTMIVNGIHYGFCWCPPGTFLMGSPDDEVDRENFETQHEVTLTKGFWLQESEVTQRLWLSVTDRTIQEELLLHRPNVGGVFEANEMKKIEQIGVGDDYPIYYVSWMDANEFCRTLKEKTGLFFTLPTEAQWEYACRAGTAGPFAAQHEEKTYEDSNGVAVTTLSVIDPADLGWFLDNSGGGVHPVKTRLPNPWGFYDMHGNVWEICSDRYSKDYYDDSPPSDPTGPTGPTAGHYRVNRGGGWFSYKKFCRSACRYRNAPDYRYNNLGFRVAVIPE